MHFTHLILFVHVSAALWLAVGVVGSLVVRGRLRRDLEPAARTLAIELLVRLHRTYTLPGLVVAGLVGFSLVTAVGYGFDQLWIAGSSLLFVLLFHLSLFGVTPRLSRLRRFASRSTSSADLGEQLQAVGWRRLLDLQALLLLAIVALMTVKP